MEFGKGTIRRSGINTLHSSIHHKHGLAWTDGTGVFLVPVSIRDGNVVHSESLKLGEFDYVQSVHWSHDLELGFCYMCLVHTQTVSIWKVEGKSPDLNIRQCRKINATVIPQGCLWNPSRDILCILNKNQCSFYFSHSKNKGSFALPTLDNGTITCGTWTRDGQKLIVSIGPTIAVYSWMNIDKSICEYNMLSWRVPGLDGRICSMVGLTSDHIACTMELPLDKLCKYSKDMFQLPDLNTANGVSGDWSDDSNGYVRPRKHTDLSVTDSLLHLQHSGQGVNDSSQLLLISTNGKNDPHTICSKNLPNIIVPDLLHFEVQLQLMIVGSHAQNALHVFSLRDNSLDHINTLTLQSNERPKGLSSAPVHQPTLGGLLVMLGKLVDNNSAFPSASSDTDYLLSLKCLPILPAYRRSQDNLAVKEFYMPSDNDDVHLVKVNPQCEAMLGESSLTKKTLERAQSDMSEIPRPKIPPRRNSKRSGNAIGRSSSVSAYSPQKERRYKESNNNDYQQEWRRSESFQYVSDKERPRTLSHSRSQDDNLSLESSSSIPEEMPPVAMRHIGITTNVISPLDHLKDIHCDDETENGVVLQSQLVALEDDIKTQGDQISNLHARLQSVIKQLDDTSCVPSTKYQTTEAPELINITCHNVHSEDITKTFLLDNGRLQLQRVQDAFELRTVELFLEGDISCVVGSNIDGYIPMKFKPGSKLSITGRRIAMPVTPTSSTVSAISMPDSAISVHDQANESFESDS